MSSEINSTSVNVDRDRVVQLATDICSLQDDSSEAAVAEYVAEVLGRNRAIEVHIEDVVLGRPNVIATVKGSGERAPLVLNGHTDASIVAAGWTRDPHTPWAEGTRLYGAGINDMLGAVAAMVAAVEVAPALRDLPGDLILQAVMHHDTIGLGTKYALASEGPRGGFAICGEPSSMAIHTANGGAIKFVVELGGVTAHVSRREQGSDTLSCAVDIYRALNDRTFEHEPSDRLPDLPRILLGQMSSGFAPAAVPDKTTILGDIRTTPGMSRVQVRREIEEIVAANVPDDISHRVRLTAVQSPFIGPTSGWLIDAISSAYEALRGRSPDVTNELPGQAFVTDASDLAAAGLESVVFGAGDWHHAPDQFVEIGDLVDSARIYLAVAATAGGPDGP